MYEHKGSTVEVVLVFSPRSVSVVPRLMIEALQIS